MGGHINDNLSLPPVYNPEWSSNATGDVKEKPAARGFIPRRKSQVSITSSVDTLEYEEEYRKNQELEGNAEQPTPAPSEAQHVEQVARATSSKRPVEQVARATSSKQWPVEQLERATSSKRPAKQLGRAISERAPSSKGSVAQVARAVTSKRPTNPE